MLDLGTVRPGSTIRIPFSTFDKDDGSAITMTNFAVGDILVYKDGSTTERASTSGFTATTDFDSKTGKQLIVLDLADNTTAGFWAAGSEYLVAIDQVTVDTVTVGGWVARFKIGHEGAWFDTTIATLSSQTSFTLTAGPAEDDALNGHWAIIHDVASAVQCSRVLILDYTGSTKTVTLAAGATFTAAATDNISIMGMAPLQPATTGRTLTIESDGMAHADLKEWLGTAPLALSSQQVQAVVPSTQQVDVNTIKTQSVTCAAGVTVGAFVGQGTAAIGVNASGHVSRVVLVDTITTYTGDTPQTGDSFARIGAAGAGLTDLGGMSATMKGQVQTEAEDALIAHNLDHLVKIAVDTDFATTVHVDSVIGQLAQTADGGFSRATDSVEAIRDNMGTAQTGDSYAIVNSGTHGNAALKTLIDTVDDFLDTEIAAIKAKTDLIPASPAAVGSAMTLTSSERDSIAAALLDLANGVETGFTLRQVLRLEAAVLLGKSSNGGKTFRDVNDTKDRVAATMDGSNNRTAVTRDAT